MAIRFWSAACAALFTCCAHAAEPGWPVYGGDQGGQRYSAARQITPENVGKLEIAWTFSTGAMKHHTDSIKDASFENTPILADGRLYVCSPFNAVSAVDPGTGKQLWRFDPKIDPHLHYANNYNCRGVAFWEGGGAGRCASRIFLNTNDRRLIALDAKTGKPCADFGRNGTVVVDPQFKPVRKGQAAITSPPVVARGLVIVGSSLDDNQRLHELPGIVNAFDAKTGALKWRFDPLASAPFKSGAANVWAPMSVDEARGLLFLPTSSPSPDFYGAERAGDDHLADAVVALEIDTGQVAWSFQTVHHNVWDYDLPAQPTLGIVTYKGKTRPAVLQPTKQGLLFTFDRETGAPLIPVAPKPLSPSRIKPADAFGLTFWDRGKCRKMIAQNRADGLYTPPTLQGTLVYPFTGGGMNWGGLAFDQSRDVVYVNTSSALHVVTLSPRKDFARRKAAEPGKEISPQAGTHYGMRRDLVVSPLGMPCNPPPWGELHAIDMHDGRVLWSVPLGTTEDLAPFSQYLLGKTGTPNFGGPIATAGGLVFIGAAMDNYLRAFDAKTGKELWRGRLPAGGQATPMTYMWKGRQYVVIAAGGHAKSDTKRGDTVIAFALPS
jgi:quinoprotein glucose dehydrogenase